MIREAVSRQNVSWSDRWVILRPVDAKTRRIVLDAYHQEQRVRPARIRPTRKDAEELTGTALFVMQLFASGLAVGAVAEHCGCHRQDITRFVNSMGQFQGVSIESLRHLDDISLDGIRQFVTGSRVKDITVGPLPEEAAV